MINLLWSLLNLFLVLSFYYFAIGLVVRGRKFLAPYFKPFVLFVLVFGTFGFLNLATKGSERNVKINNRPSTVEKVLVSEYLSNKLFITLIRDGETGEINPEFSTSDLQGLVMGLKWNHFQVIEKDGKLELAGWWDWSLMGNRVFSSFETYSIPKGSFPN
ncbi:MAG: hypothetical protein ACK4SF_09220 [Algoriphagus aquaeductus]|uniref:hypothetical protein n=1 Tax=Algoriphagus aquaeductus TaxID=475299 RepID=UPI0039194C32